MVTKHYDTVIIGAGLTGLSAAYHLPGNTLLLDKADTVGGACRSTAHAGFVFDRVGHLSLTRDTYAQQLIARLLGDNLYFQPGASWVYTPDTPMPRRAASRTGDTGAAGPFLYPLYGGMQALADAFLSALAADLRLNSRVTGIDVQRQTVVVNGAEEIGYDWLISTIPLPELAQIIPTMPPTIRRAVSGLIHVPISCVYLGIDRPVRTDTLRIDYPAHEFIMQRVFVQGNASPQAKPEGTSSFTLEIRHAPDRSIAETGLIERVIADAIRARLLTRRDRILVAEVQDLEYAYPVDTPERPRQVAQVRDWLRRHGIATAGRFGTWEELALEGALLAGKAVAAHVAGAQPAQRAQSAVPTIPAIADRERSPAVVTSGSGTSDDSTSVPPLLQP